MSLLLVSDWDTFLSGFPDAHILQTSAWGELKSSFGWGLARLSSGNSGAQILFRRLPFGFHLAYIPKGPLGSDWDNLWPEVDALCRQRKTIFLRVEPDLWEDAGAHTPDTVDFASPPHGFRLGLQSIQPQRTLLVDLSGEEEQVLARMKQKTRYNIRLALKKGVVVRPFSDLGVFHHLMKMTGGRDAFGVHNLAYYLRAYELFHPQGACELLVAEFAGEPLAALMVFAHGKRAWYFYGASANEHRDRMPTYLIQWEAIRWARAQGCLVYDLWGVPDADEGTLEANFIKRRAGLWSVYRFKRGFGGQLCRALGPWDRVYRPGLYSLYRLWTEKRRREENTG